MANTKEIQNRIKSIKDTQKITNAMYMISSSKLKKARTDLENTEPYFYTLQVALARMLRHVPEMEHLYFDSREGIKEEEIPYIWDRYYKSSRTFRRNMNSTGLGLAIVKSIAETLECRHGVISHVNRGSLFYFEIPEKHR